MLEIKKILFPIDFTENSSKILPYVLYVSEKHDGMIYLLHVVEDLSKWSSGSYIPHIPVVPFARTLCCSPRSWTARTILSSLCT